MQTASPKELAVPIAIQWWRWWKSNPRLEARSDRHYTCSRMLLTLEAITPTKNFKRSDSLYDSAPSPENRALKSLTNDARIRPVSIGGRTAA